MGNAHGSVKEKIDIRRLHDEIAKVLEKLKRTPWKKEDGSFKKYVKKRLKQLDNAYKKLDHPQVKQAQNDIAKAIIEAKIIPNICGVLTFLYKENMELSVSHKYDGISSIATGILCNYANAAEFATEVANCPGFLEFISELLAESSENFLQIDTQETKLKDRIDVFIKIVSNISNSPTTIPRLRTLNFKAALEPYLKANDADILDTTIDILTRIKVVEVFETNGVTSEDASSSQITAPNWPIVVEKITRVISNELKCLHDIEWKEENGAFKTNVLKSLRLIIDVYLELERRNAPEDFVLQSQKEIASVLIDANVIPKICGVLTDLHFQTLEITDNERNEKLSSDAHKILCNCACTSDEFAEHLAKIPGFLEFVNAKLTSASEEILQLDKKETQLKARIDVFIKIVSNISKYPTNIPRLRTLNFTAALEPYLKAKDSDVLNSTINILTRIKIDEVIETIGVTTDNAPSSSISVPNWQIVVERVTGLITNELEDLHDIEWKEENGTYKANILRSLRLIDEVYFALVTRNVPQEYVLQSRKEIASILINANIVPKICVMLTDLHFHTLEITDSVKNETLSSDAQSIICNYTNATDGFAEHVAKIPGFLEFVNAKLTTASEENLQIDMKETKLNDRIDVFIRIVGNISNSPTNIPRLRTCNFTAALEPYLKGNDGVILNTTINTLTSITIGEVFETKGITSEGTPSSQTAAPHWQTVVERVTGLISNELKDLHDIEWKEESGAYKIKIFESLRLIQTVYFALKNQNAPAVKVTQARMDIASLLIDANIVPKICGMLMDLHLHTLEITDSERNVMLSSDAQSILRNYTCASDDFAEHVANIPGFLEFISAKLTSASEEYLQLDKKETKLKDRIDLCIKIVSNISSSPTNIPRLRTCNLTAALEPYLKANDSVILNITINTLTRITIGEVFETKGITSEDTPSSQTAAPNWQTAVERVTGLIANELKDLHDIEWKEENGAYKIKIFKSLRIIHAVFFALKNRNAPAVNVKQSRMDIASILIDANIVPKICGMFMDVHLHTREITDSERNEKLSSDAQSILCNYANACDGFAEHVANIPGFLEFISAKLTSASEEYLQIDKKETKLKDRFDVFIKMVYNISYSPTNIPRLRTCNFTAALEPYLEAKDDDVLDTTMDILTFIKIGEVFETNGHTSEDTSSSQIVAPNWQTVVERVTELISNELKDLHDIEWKEENGAYKTNILKSVRLIDMVYFALVTRNVPQEYVMQSRKDIASVLIDANIIPKICGVLTDLHDHTLEITDSERNERLSSDAQRILLNYTYDSDDFPAHVANSPEFLEFIRAKLTSASEEYLQLEKKETKLKDRIDGFIKIVGNISNSPTNIPRLRTCNFTAALEPYLKANGGVILNNTLNVLTRIKIDEVFEKKGITSVDTSSSQITALNWQILFGKVTALIANELKNLHDIEWKEDNGAYKANILRSLKLIVMVYFALEERNAPEVYVTQSRKEIASVLIDSNIIPKICGVLMDLHLHALDISDNERNKMLSSDAQIILYNYSITSDDFAEHVANISGFLEFISAKITSASQEYLQLDKKETKLKARIDVFIKIVGNIANSQTNILRIRTLVVMFDDVKVDVRIELLMIQSLCISSMTNVLLKLHVPLIIDFILNDRDFFTIICLHEKKLKSCINVFIQMVGNISNSPRNIPRLRTCNFMAALEPYVEANGGAILNNTLDILTRIKIGVVFETKGLLSEDTSSSQIAVPIWQTVVERVTGLISNELKDGHDIEWKEENGAYKTSILKNLKLIEMVYYALENQNAQAVYVKQSRKDIASVLIDANVIPKICGVLTDLHHHTLEIIDHGRNKILSLVAQRILWAYTDTVRGFGEYVANITGFLEFIIAKLASESKTHLQLDKEDSFKGALLGCVVIVHNISKSESCRTRLRSIGTIDVLKPYLKSTDYDIQLSALATLAAITNEDESEIIKSNEQSVIHLMDRLRQGLKSVIRRSSGWSCEESALAIRTLARNDANKKLLVQLGALELLVELSKGDEDEQTEAVRALWDLSFDEDNCKKMMTEEKLELISVLDKMKASDHKLISEAAYGTLWNLRDLLQNSKLQRYRNIAKSMMTAREGSLPDVSRELKPEGHIMISYHLSHQKTLLMIKEELVKKGFKIWMDVELMMGSILQATAEAVENADIVLICLSNKYKNSKSCRREVEYADRLDKMIVPLQLEEGYRPDGWLGLIAGGLKSYDFSGCRPIKSELNGLLSALRKMKDEIHSDPKENTIQYAERSCSGAVGGTPLSPMEIDDSRAGDADAASMASIESSSDDADTIEDAVETVDIIDGPITQEHINQARLCNVINTVCADVLRDVLLSQFTNIHKSLLKSRTTIAGMHRIGQEQFQLIFPDPHCRYTGTVDQFDITLLYTLIRNISSCPAPVTGWGKPPTDQPRDVSLSANVERIRLLRNKVSGHSVDGKLDDQACEDYFGEIGELLNDVEAELGDKGYKGALKERQTQIITPKEAKVLRAQFESYRHQLKEDMRDVVETHESVKEAMEALEAKVEKLSTAIAQNL